MGTPLPDWEGLPILPDAIEGRPAGLSYVYSANTALDEAVAFYLDEMGLAGWGFFNREESDDGLFGPTISLSFSNTKEIAQIILIYSVEENYTMVQVTVAESDEVFEDTVPEGAEEVPLLESTSFMITIDDLPPGFEELQLADKGISEEELQKGMEIESSFVFEISTSEHLESIIGLATTLPYRLRETHDDESLIRQTNILAESIAIGFSGNNAVALESMEFSQDIGDVIVGRTFAEVVNGEGLEDYFLRSDVVT